MMLKQRDKGAINFKILALNGRVIFGAILRNEITVVGPVKYATNVAVEITAASVPSHGTMSP